MIDGATILKRIGNLRTRVIDDETVIFNQDNGEIVVLNELGSRVFELTADEIRVDQIVERLLEEYRVDLETLESDVLSFAHELFTAGIIADSS